MDVTESMGFAAYAHGMHAIAGVFFDADNDGWTDVLILGLRTPTKLFRNRGGKFVEDPGAMPKEELGKPWDIALLDYDLDGYFDIFILNYLAPNQRMGGDKDQYAHIAVGNKDYGGPNFLLKNEAGKKFSIVPNAGGLSSGRMTQAAAVGDFNDDLYPDIFLANDYGFDALFLNQAGKGFQESDTIGSIRSRNSMSGATGDFNNDGKIDIYVTNVNKAGIRRGFNSLWENSGNGALIDRGTAASVAKCGWSWGAAFVDMDKDGWQNIFVVNGHHGKKKNKHWYRPLNHLSLHLH